MALNYVPGPFRTKHAVETCTHTGTCKRLWITVPGVANVHLPSTKASCVLQ